MIFCIRYANHKAYNSLIFIIDEILNALKKNFINDKRR